MYGLTDYAVPFHHWYTDFEPNWSSPKATAYIAAGGGRILYPGIESCFKGIIVQGGVCIDDDVACTNYHQFPRITIAKVPDGLSKTVLAMEKAAYAPVYQPDPNEGQGSFWDIVNGGWTVPSYTPTMRFVDDYGDVQLLADSEKYPLEIGQSSNGWNNSDGTVQEWGFGSAHSSIVNSVWADGSVRPISLRLSNDPYNRMTNQPTGNNKYTGAPSKPNILLQITCRDDGQATDPNSY